MKKERQEIHWSTLNAHWAHRKVIVYFMALIQGHKHGHANLNAHWNMLKVILLRSVCSTS